MSNHRNRRTILSALEWGTAELAKAGGGSPRPTVTRCFGKAMPPQRSSMIPVGASRCGVTSPRLDAEVILAHLMEVERIRLYLDFDSPIGEHEAREYMARVKRRAGGEPVAYITGRKEFYSRVFFVNPDVLIPRPETECVVDAAIKSLDGVERPEVLDLCSGSGNIGATIAAEIPDAAVTCVDISRAAVETGRKNAERLGVATRVAFVTGDLFAGAAGRTFDLVVSNPPYIPRGMIDTLQVEIARYEPRGALDGGADGTDVIRRIAAEAPAHLKDHAALVVEIGEWMGDALKKELESTGAYAGCTIGTDLSGRPRYLAARTK